MVSTKERQTAAFNNVVQLIAHLQLPGQVVPLFHQACFAFNAQLTYNALLAHLQLPRQIMPLFHQACFALNAQLTYNAPLTHLQLPKQMHQENVRRLRFK